MNIGTYASCALAGLSIGDDDSCVPAEVLAGLNLGAAKHCGNHLCVAAYGDALVESIEIVVVEGEAHGEALNDKGRELSAGAAPLLLGVAFDELLVNVRAHQRDGLLLEVLGVGNAGLAALGLDLLGSFLGSYHAPHLIEGVHVEWERVELAVKIGNRGIGESVESGEFLHVIPDFSVVGVEDVGAVLVDVDFLYVFGVDITGYIWAAVDDQDFLAGGSGFVSEDCTVKTGADYEIIIF